jgi:hypothetical protein
LFIKQRGLSAGAQRLQASRFQIERQLCNDVCLKHLDKKGMDKNGNFGHNVLWLAGKAVYTFNQI